MKKKILGAIAVVAIAAMAAFNLNIDADTNELSALTMDNIVALADGESGGDKTCYNTITSKEGSQVLYCQSCTWVSGTYSWTSSSGKC